MKKNILLLIILLLSIKIYCQTENEPLNIKFNRIDYFAPADRMSLQSVSEILKVNSYINIDFNLNKIKIITYFSSNPNEDEYTIVSINNSNEDILKFICRASNSVEAIFELNIIKKTITRKITHNGIIHKYFNQ